MTQTFKIEINGAQRVLLSRALRDTARSGVGYPVEERQELIEIADCLDEMPMLDPGSIFLLYDPFAEMIDD